MMDSKKVGAWALAVVSLGLTVTGVVLAATDPNPADVAKDSLALNGYPPKTADVQLVISTGQDLHVSANVWMNFTNDAMAAQVSVPMIVSTVEVDMRLVHGSLYTTSPSFSSIFGSRWIATSAKQPSLFGLSLEMTKPDISLISGFNNESVTTNGYFKTYTFTRDNLILSTGGTNPIKAPASAKVVFAVTVGKQGEVTASTIALTSKVTSLYVTATVLSYNQPAKIVAPPSKDVTREKISALQKLFAGTPLSSMLGNLNLSNLGKVQLS